MENQQSITKNSKTNGMLLFFLLLYCNITIVAQENPSSVKLMPYYSGWGGHLEYSYFKINSVGIGLNYMIEPLHKKILNRQVVWLFDFTIAGLFYQSNFCLGQRIDFGVNCEKFSPDLRIFFEHNGDKDIRLGGKIGLSLGNFVYIHYRYSIPISNTELDVSRHGITVSAKLNWVAFSHLYDK